MYTRENQQRNRLSVGYIKPSVTSARREAQHLYSQRERAALAWTEAVTHLSDDHVPDAAYATARAGFSDVGLVQLTFAILAINGGNRFNVVFRTPASNHPPGMFKHMKPT